MISVGQIPYLNCEPFFYGLQIDDVELCPMAPSAMGPLAKNYELDAGPFSLIQSFDLADTYEPLGNMGISVKGPVLSILLYSRMPIDELSGSVVGVTAESATAVQLLKVVLEHRYNASHLSYVGLDVAGLDAFLLIGDEALINRKQVDGFPYRYDLAEEWFDWYGLPFVFAVWMVRKDLESDYKSMLCRCLQNNLATNMDHNLTAIADVRDYMGLSSTEVVNYLQAFRYVLYDEDRHAIKLFKEAWRQLSD